MGASQIKEIVLAFVIGLIVSGCGKPREEKTTGNPSQNSTPQNVRQQKIKTIGYWVCSQCGAHIESKTQPSGGCPSRKNAPHAWGKKGETQVEDDEQAMTIWQCRKCFKIMIYPGGVPPSGIRCPVEKNAPHGLDKIGEQ